jgi:hypothetical protein
MRRYEVMGESLEQFSLIDKNDDLFTEIHSELPPFTFKHLRIRSGIDSANFTHNSRSILSHSSRIHAMRAVLEKNRF